jgi:hypothetical protein
MRKIFIIAASIAALAIPAASMAATYNDFGVGSVTKGDVQTVLGWNNAAFDAKAGSVEFTQKSVFSAHYALRCNDTDYVDDTTATTTHPVTATVITDGNGRQITGWNLTGAVPGTTTETTHTNPNARSQFFSCVIGGGDVGPSASSSNTTQLGLYVNGIGLPNTPVVVPAPV